MTSLANIIHQQIAENGAMTVEHYMQLCLQHPEFGYYRKANPIGTSGDFTTAPEISQIFGDLLGLWAADASAQLKAPFALVELGAGRGTLAVDMMRMLGKAGIECELHLVESNDTLMEMQREKLVNYTVIWHEIIASLPKDKPLIIIANEFFDALPIRQWVEGEELRVASCEEDLIFTPEGEVTAEDCPAAQAIMHELCARLKAQGGRLLVVDYGYEENSEFRIQNSGEDSLFPTPLSTNPASRNTLQAVRNHAYSNPLEYCGESDLTAHVNFSALTEIAIKAGCTVAPIIEQGAFLQSLGGDIWLQKLMEKLGDTQAKLELEAGWIRLISPSQMGSLFKVMIISDSQSESR